MSNRLQKSRYTATYGPVTVEAEYTLSISDEHTI